MNTPRLKHVLLILFVFITAVLFSTISTAGAATADLIISEYGEGSSFNKYIEIYNGTGASVDLSDYEVWRVSNGGTWPEATIALSGTLNDGQVLVVHHSSAGATISSAGDLQISSGTLSHNGDDAIGLAKNSTLIDAVGEDGADPGSGWDVAGTSNGTTDNVLVRKDTVCAPNTDWTASRGTNTTDSEWIVLNNEDWSDIGVHTANCSGGPTPTFTPVGPTPTFTPPPPTATPSPTTSDLKITGVIDGPLSGGIPKAIEVYVINNIADLSIYGLGSANNGGGTDGQEFTFPAVSATAGTYIYVASESTGFSSFFGFAPDYTSGMASINGDDAIELFQNGSVADVFGDIGTDGSGQPWEYLDGWAYRVDGTGPDGSTFNLANWTFSGKNALDGETTNATATTPFPHGKVIGQALPIDESFDSCTLAGWEIISVDADTGHTWGCNATYSNIEANGYGDSAPADEWLITPGLNLNAQENDTLTFRNYTNYSDNTYPTLSVLYSTDYNGNGDPTSATWTALTGINLSPESSNSWVDSGDVDLSGISGVNVYVAFHYTSSGTGGGSAATWRLDSINLFEGINATAYKIHEVQGNGFTSPLVGEFVIVEGVVVGDFQDSGELGGFFMQEEDADADADAATSEGIFVSSSTAVAIGDVVRVTGLVEENYGLTRLTSVAEIIPVATGASVSETAVSLPLTSSGDLEVYEGMLVTFPQDLVISEFFNFDRYGEIVLSTDRQFQPTAIYEPGSPEAAALAASNQLSRITLDDGRSGQNPDPARHPNGAAFDLSNTFRGGDTVQDTTGVIDYAFGAYKIQPTTGATYTSQNPRTAVPDVGGEITVASFNVLNYFTTLDDSGSICGPDSNMDCRGADDQEELDRQRDKIVAALADINADVVGLIEIENHATDAAVQDLVAGLNDVLGAGTYNYVATGSIGTDAIKVAFIYKTTSVTLAGSHAILDSSVDARFNDDKNRPVLAQSFMDTTGGVFTVAVNHLKSKGSNCNSIGDPDVGDGSGNCNLTRAAAAEALVDWLAVDPTGSGDNDFLIIGDLNSYDKEDPIDAILVGTDDTASTTDDYVDLLDLFGGEYAYSYVFSGELGYLDYALANETLQLQISGAAAWHANSDEADLLDYDTSYKQDAQDALYEPNAYRASDHDPVIVGLNLSPYILNGDGCIVLALEGSPFDGFATVVESRHGRFNALSWKHAQGLPIETCFEIHGTNGNDRLYGAYANDTIFGYDGNDKLYGRDGNDTLIGGVGNDYLNGGLGDFDRLFGDEGNDRLVDRDGVLEAHGGSGNDKLTITLRYGWLSPDAQFVVDGITGGYDNDTVRLTLKDQTGHYFVSISGDEYDDPPSPEEGNDSLKLRGHITPDSEFVKFENTNIR